MSERHYADWCKTKLGLSKEFEDGFNKGYEYAKATIKPQVVTEYVQDPVTVRQIALNNEAGLVISKHTANCTCQACAYGKANLHVQGASNL